MYNGRVKGLQAQKIRPLFSNSGTQAELLLIEPNGDKHPVRCLCKFDGSLEIFGETDMVGYLNYRFGRDAVAAVARDATLQPQ